MIEINQDFADGVLHSRNPETNKNDYGRILCVCGSAGYTGAGVFLRAGRGTHGQRHRDIGDTRGRVAGAGGQAERTGRAAHAAG